MKFNFEKLETTFHHGGGKSEPAIYVSMAACLGNECLEVNEWIAVCDDSEELIKEFKKESKRFLLNEANWLKHGAFKNGKFKPFKTNLSIPNDK